MTVNTLYKKNMPTQKDIYNPSGKTPEEMNQQALLQMQNRVMGESAAAPGTLVTGAQIGVTPPGQIAQTPTMFQAFTTTEARKKAAGIASSMKDQGISYEEAARRYDAATLPPIAEKAVDSAGDTSLTSTPAQTFLESAKSDLQKRQEESNASIAAASASFHTGAQKSYEQAKGKIDERLKPQEERLKEQKTEQTATQKAAAFKMEQAGTDYAEAALTKIRVEQARDTQELAWKKQDLLNQAWDAALGANVQGYQALERGAAEIQKQIDKTIKESAQSQKDIADMQKADVQEGGILYSAAKGGTLLTDSQLRAHDIVNNYQPGTSRILFRASLESVKEENYKAADSLAGVLAKTDVGGSVEIGGIEYVVSGKANGVINSVEKDKATGENMAVSYDPKTRTTTSTPMGTFSSNWQVKVRESDGTLWRVNPDTKEAEKFGGVGSVPLIPGPVQITNANLFRDGTIGPTLPGHEKNAGQCGAATNAWYGKQVIKHDDFAGKVTDLQPYAIEGPYSGESIQSHDTFLMRAGTTGHVGIIGDIFTDNQTGKTMFTVTESNFVPPNGRMISNSRVMAIDDPRIALFARVPITNLPQTGSDATQVGVSDGWGAAPESKPLSRTDLEAVNAGLPPEKQLSLGATAADATSAGYKPGVTPRVPGALDELTRKELNSMDEQSKSLWTNTSDSDRDIARQLVNGDMLLSEASARAVGKSPDSEKMRLNKLALTLDPTFSPIRNKQRADFKTSWNNPNQRPYNIRVSGNTALSHLAELKHWTDQLQNTRFMKANSLKNAIDKNINKPELAEAIQNFDYTAELLAHEIAAFYKGNASPTDQDVAQQREKINNMKPNDILNSLINLQVNTMGAKIIEQGVEYKKVMGRYPDSSIVDPNAITSLKDVGVDTSRLEKLMSEQTNSKVINLKGPDGQIYPYDLSDPELKNEYDEALKNGFTKQ